MTLLMKQYYLQICPWEWMRQYSHYNFIPPKVVSKDELEKYLEEVEPYLVGKYNDKYTRYKKEKEEWLVGFWEVGTKSSPVSES